MQKMAWKKVYSKLRNSCQKVEKQYQISWHFSDTIPDCVFNVNIFQKQLKLTPKSDKEDPFCDFDSGEFWTF